MLKRWLIWLTLLCSTGSGWAQPAAHLYRGQVNIDNQSSAAIQSAFRQGLVQVLTKVSGNPSIDTLPKIKNQLNRAKSLVQSYQYAANPDAPPALRLTIQYDKAGILKLLTDNGQAIWQTSRPLTLIWITTENGNTITTTDTNETKKEIDATAEQRGLPIIFPMMDLQDQAITTTSTLSAQQTQSLLERYHAEAILVGNIQSNKTPAVINWQYLSKQQPMNWQSHSPSLLNALDDGINQLSDMLANQFSVIQSSNLRSTYTLSIQGINTLSDYGRLIKLVKNNNLIDQYEIKDMNNDTVIINISSGADLTSINQSILASHKLTAAEPSDTAANTLSYQWTTSNSAVVINTNSGIDHHGNTVGS